MSCDRQTFSVHNLPWEAHGPPLSAAFSPSLALARPGKAVPAQLLSNALLPSFPPRTVALARAPRAQLLSEARGREEEEGEGFLMEFVLEGRFLERVPTPINWRRRRGTGERAVILLTCTSRRARRERGKRQLPLSWQGERVCARCRAGEKKVRILWK